MAAAAASNSSTITTAILRLDNRYRTSSSSTTTHQCLQVRAAQGFRDEGGRSRNQIDDANLRLLREKVEVMRAKESLERLFVASDHHLQDEAAGWTNVAGYKHQNRGKQSHFLELLLIVCGTFGLTVAGGTLCLCLAAILVHLNNQ